MNQSRPGAAGGGPTIEIGATGSFGGWFGRDADQPATANLG